MKFLLLSLVFVITTSCGKKNTSEGETSSETSNPLIENGRYEMPKIGFHKAVPINYRLENLYENFTVNPSSNKEVIGDNPFHVYVDEDNALEVRFYSKIDLKTVSYIDLGNQFELSKIAGFTPNILFDRRLKRIPDFYREFTYGQSNTLSPEQDMLNKVFIIETARRESSMESNMKLMIWVECHGGFQYKSKDSYQCGHGNLRFNYKLLDYKLTKVDF